MVWVSARILIFFFVLFWGTLSLPTTFGQPDLPVAEPKLLSVFPLGGEHGKTVQLAVRGNSLAGAYAVWFDEASLTGQLLKVEEVKEDSEQKVNPFEEEPKKPLPVYQALLKVDIPPAARLGIHSLRLVSAQGVSNAVAFRVVDEPTVVETADPHQTPEHAQAVSFPVVVYGKLGKLGEMDYYSFHAKEGQELWFEAVMDRGNSHGWWAKNFDARLALYRAGGSWFNPDQPRRLLFQEQRSLDLLPVQARGTYHFRQDAEYLLEVSSVFGKGCPDCSYQLRIAPAAQTPISEVENHSSQSEWQERTFSRTLQDDWITILQARAVDGSPESSASNKAGSSAPATGNALRNVGELLDASHLPARPLAVVEKEPNDGASEALGVSIPCVIEGAIDRPGDIDSYKFKVEPSQKLALEIQTPKTKPPHFNPRLGVINRENREPFSNVHRVRELFNNQANPQVLLKGVEPKANHTFEEGGEYILQIRDITSRYGDSSYTYRILIRSQIPHLGEVSVAEGDRVNLVRGEAKKLTITASYEEGFNAEALFMLEGLPEAVQAVSAVDAGKDRGPGLVTENPETVAPKQQRATIVLLADPAALITRLPVVVRLYCRPLIDGRLGSRLLVREIPLMVVEGSRAIQEEKH